MSAGTNIHAVRGERTTEVMTALSARVGDEQAALTGSLVAATRLTVVLHQAVHGGASTQTLCVLAETLEDTIGRLMKLCAVNQGDVDALVRAIEADTDDAMTAVRRTHDNR